MDERETSTRVSTCGLRRLFLFCRPFVSGVVLCVAVWWLKYWPIFVTLMVVKVKLLGERRHFSYNSGRECVLCRTVLSRLVSVSVTTRKLTVCAECSPK